MGIWDAFTDMVEAVTPWSVVEAEAPAEDTKVGCHEPTAQNWVRAN
jgi:hypothetical protein